MEVVTSPLKLWRLFAVSILCEIMFRTNKSMEYDSNIIFCLDDFFCMILLLAHDKTKGNTQVRMH